MGENGEITALGCEGALRRRLIDMGLIPGAHVIMKKKAPFGDPLEINVRGYELSIRAKQASKISVEV